MSETIEKAEKHFGNRRFFIVEKFKGYGGDRYTIHNNSMYDITTATRKLLALDTLNKNRDRYSYHLQEVDTGLVPLVLTEEVKKKNGEDIDLDDMPF